MRSMARASKKFISKIFLITIMLACRSGYASDISPVGLWKTMDDQTGEARGLIRITETNGKYQGRIEKIFPKPGDEANPRCQKCEGARHNQPIIGMEILWGLTKQGETYQGGQILDPETGKTYQVRITPGKGGKTLDVRGFIGFSLLGRSQTWIREE
jgi:uncharacterized protein (DUF2147 family)